MPHPNHVWEARHQAEWIFPSDTEVWINFHGEAPRCQSGVVAKRMIPPRLVDSWVMTLQQRVHYVLESQDDPMQISAFWGEDEGDCGRNHDELLSVRHGQSCTKTYRTRLCACWGMGNARPGDDGEELGDGDGRVDKGVEWDGEDGICTGGIGRRRGGVCGI